MNGVNELASTGKRRLHLVVLLCFVGLSLLLYFRTTSYYFCSDTFAFLGPLSKANLDKALFNPEQSYTYRPVPRLCWLVFFTFFGRDPFWYHVINILTHALCGFLIYLLARRLRDETWWAVFAGAIFLSMPVHFDAVSTIYHWVEPVSTCLLLTSLLLYMKATSGDRRRLPWASALVYFIAVMTKQSTASMLLFLALWEILIDRRERPIWGYIKGRIRYWLPLVAALGLAAGLNLMAKPGDRDVGMVLSISLSYRLPVFLLSTLVKAAKPWFLPGLILMVMAPLIKGGKLGRFSLFATALLPFPFYALTSDRHAYLPAVGLALALAALLTSGKDATHRGTSEIISKRSSVSRAESAKRPAPVIVDLLVLCAIFSFLLMPYRAPGPALLNGSGASGWHSQVDPAYWRSVGVVLERLAGTGSLKFDGLSAKRALLMIASLINLIAIAGLLILRAARWKGPVNPAAWKITAVGTLLLFLAVFSATTYSTTGRDWRRNSWKADEALIDLKRRVPDLPDNTTVYVSDDSAIPLLAHVKFYYDLKRISVKKYSDFFSDVAKGEHPPGPDKMRCLVFQDGRFVRSESDEALLRDKLDKRWRPEFADTEITLGRWSMPRRPGAGVQDDRWQFERFALPKQVKGIAARPIQAKASLCYSDLSVPTLAVNEAELTLGAEAADHGLHKMLLKWQLDGRRWFSRDFDLPYDGVVRRLTFKVSTSRDWFMADRLTGLCLVFEAAPKAIEVDSVTLMFGLRVGVGVTEFPGGDEQLRTALQDIFSVR